MTKPLLSILMPVYNCGKYIEDALASIQAQTFTDFEVLLIDDGCSDETPVIVRRMARHDQRIKIISRENRGIVDSLNEGVALAKGKWLARMDGDDICEPHRFSRQLAFLNARPEIGIVGSWVQLFGGRNEIWHHRREDAFIKFMLLFRSSGFSHSTVMGKTELFRQFAYDKYYEDVEDTELWTRMALCHGVQFANIPEVLVHYRVHDAQVSKIKRARQMSLYRQIMIKYMRALGVVDIDVEAHEWCCDLRSNLSVVELDRIYIWLEKLSSIRADYVDDFGVISERWAKLCALNQHVDVREGQFGFRPVTWLCMCLPR
ncbi:glycosyltransferase family 2 protein [Aeromonas allosaccharophila]|uniref:glycosyltransferase family 2 protein n=1 Tax=Aeromonas allosaccharophila TaxID=656 RepID=UPI001BCB7BF4|nr:glycosyltransferase family A protein [Aeromonas allosaccharophila]MBS4694442.1 glycosyltransferase family 2 protein [Aeromonas allosaccharophila]